MIATLQTSLVEVHEEIPCKTVSGRPKEMLAVKVEISAVRIAVALVTVTPQEIAAALVIVAVLAIGEVLVVAAVPAIAVAFQTEGVLALVIVPQVQIEEAVARVETV